MFTLLALHTVMYFVIYIGIFGYDIFPCVICFPAIKAGRSFVKFLSTYIKSFLNTNRLAVAVSS